MVTRQLCSPNTITGIDITVTSPAPAEVSETPWIRVHPHPPPPSADQNRNNVSWSGRQGGREDDEGGATGGRNIFSSSDATQETLNKQEDIVSQVAAVLTVELHD